MTAGSRDLVHEALSFGFSHAGLMAVSTLVVRDEVRGMCAADLCHAFGRSWVCPPACGELDACREIIGRFSYGLIVQTTATLADPFDYDEMMAADDLQRQRVAAFQEVLRPTYPTMVALANGACRLCPECTYPNTPCRHPEKAMPSMEAFGLVVSDVCEANGLGYYYGPDTVTYTGCYLLG